MKEIQRLKLLKRGSFTIEAACVMSLVLLAIIGILYLCFFVHNRAWLTAAACESALAGSMEGMREDGKAEETAEIRSRTLGNTGFFGMENINIHVQKGKNIKVTYTADTNAAFGGFSWKLKAEGTSKVIDPVLWIRNVKAAGEILTGGE